MIFLSFTVLFVNMNSSMMHERRKFVCCVCSDVVGKNEMGSRNDDVSAAADAEVAVKAKRELVTFQMLWHLDVKKICFSTFSFSFNFFFFLPSFQTSKTRSTALSFIHYLITFRFWLTSKVIVCVFLWRRRWLAKNNNMRILRLFSSLFWSLWRRKISLKNIRTLTTMMMMMGVAWGRRRRRRSKKIELFTKIFTSVELLSVFKQFVGFLVV